MAAVLLVSASFVFSILTIPSRNVVVAAFLLVSVSFSRHIVTHFLELLLFNDIS